MESDIWIRHISASWLQYVFLGQDMRSTAGRDLRVSRCMAYKLLIINNFWNILV